MLGRFPHTRETLPLVQAFDCGDEPWAQQINVWLKHPGENGALFQARFCGFPVWLYGAPENIIGCGALATLLIDDVEYLQIAPIAVARQYRNQPKDKPAERYSHQIMRYLLTDARDQIAISGFPRLLFLSVDPRNLSAIWMYEKHVGFQRTGVLKNGLELMRLPLGTPAPFEV